MKLTINEIKHLVQIAFGIEDLSVRTRLKEYVYARVLFAEECIKIQTTTVRIAKELGIGHCNVWHYLNNYKHYPFLVNEYKPKYEQLKQEYEKSRI